MDYGALPPEINSGRMYAGAGAGPMLAAAVAWDGLATDLYTTAASHSAAISDLTGVWSGPASASMAAAAAPYVAWLTATAAQAEQTSIQAKAAAAAYEAAFAMTVPPPVIAANRAQLMALIATNFFGQNLPAIAVTEAHYAEMWAQDAAAMYGYAAASAGASTLTTFDQPPSTTNPAGSAGQAAAVARAADTAASTSQSLASVPSTLQALALPTSSSGASATAPVGLKGILTWLLGEPVESSNWYASPLARLLSPMYNNDVAIVGNHLASAEHGLKLWDESPKPGGGAGAGAAAGVSGLGGSTLGGGGAVSAGASAGVSAGVGKAGTVGKLSVPQSWAAAAPATHIASPPSPVISAGAGAKADGMLRGIPLYPGGAGRPSGGNISQRYGFRHAVMPRPMVG